MPLPVLLDQHSPTGAERGLLRLKTMLHNHGPHGPILMRSFVCHRGPKCDTGRARGMQRVLLEDAALR